MGQWRDKVAVITGAGSGIGSGLARHAAALQMRVIAADIDVQGLQSLKDDLETQGLSIVISETDVTNPESVESLARSAFDSYGKVNLLFNNAGVLVDGKSWERSIEDWRWNIDVNVMGVINGIRSFVPKMLAQGEAGRIINTSSIGGLLAGSAYNGPYQGTKHFVASLTETLYGELRNEGELITASVLCPGEVDTGIWYSDRLRPEEQHNKLGSEAEQAYRDRVAGNCAKGLSPAEFATRVFERIEDNKFWILPQPEFKAMYQMRVDAVMNETHPLSVLEMMERIAPGKTSVG